MDIERLNQIYEMQKELDKELEEEQKLEKDSLIRKRLLAFLVELGELVDETKVFKYWDELLPGDKEKILEEYVECLHFLLGLCDTFGVVLTDEIKIEELDIESYTDCFLEVYKISSLMINKMDAKTIEDSLSIYLGLGIKLGFSMRDIIEAYIKRNQEV